VEDDKSGQGASLRVPHKPHVPSRTATRVVGARGGCSHRIAGQAAVRPAPNSFPEWLVPARTARCHDPRGQTQAVMSRAKVASSRRLILGLAHRGAGSERPREGVAFFRPLGEISVQEAPVRRGAADARRTSSTITRRRRCKQSRRLPRLVRQQLSTMGHKPTLSKSRQAGRRFFIRDRHKYLYTAALDLHCTSLRTGTGKTRQT